MLMPHDARWPWAPPPPPGPPPWGVAAPRARPPPVSTPPPVALAGPSRSGFSCSPRDFGLPTTFAEHESPRSSDAMRGPAQARRPTPRRPTNLRDKNKLRVAELLYDEMRPHSAEVRSEARLQRHLVGDGAADAVPRRIRRMRSTEPGTSAMRAPLATARRASAWLGASDDDDDDDDDTAMDLASSASPMHAALDVDMDLSSALSLSHGDVPGASAGLHDLATLDDADRRLSPPAAPWGGRTSTKRRHEDDGPLRRRPVPPLPPWMLPPRQTPPSSPRSVSPRHRPAWPSPNGAGAPPGPMGSFPAPPLLRRSSTSSLAMPLTARDSETTTTHPASPSLSAWKPAAWSPVSGSGPGYGSGGIALRLGARPPRDVVLREPAEGADMDEGVRMLGLS